MQCRICSEPLGALVFFVESLGKGSDGVPEVRLVRMRLVDLKAKIEEQTAPAGRLKVEAVCFPRNPMCKTMEQDRRLWGRRVRP